MFEKYFYMYIPVPVGLISGKRPNPNIIEIENKIPTGMITAS
jgi:hypothetical protein